MLFFSLELVGVLLLLSGIVGCNDQTKDFTVPLAYALDPNTPDLKYPIILSFNQSKTTTPFKSPYLPLYNINLTMQTQSFTPSPTPSSSPTTPTPTPRSSQLPQVTIGLKYPSQFLEAVRQTFKVEAHDIELGKEQYTQLIVRGNNFVESSDQFINGGIFKMKAKYNYGESVEVDNQLCVLVDDETVVFDQFLILEILIRMDKRNKIRYVQHPSQNMITLSGDIKNFPKISFTSGKSIFQLQLKPANVLYYSPRSSSSSISYNKIGYKALSKFSKFQIEKDNKIIFKRTSQLYQLYIFLAYFFVFVLGFQLICRAKIAGSVTFVKSVVQWVVLADFQARGRVLRTELE